MKRILGLAMAAVLMIAVVGGGTWAAFSDPEYVGNNEITAGYLDLKIGASGSEADYTSGSPYTFWSALTGRYPGQTGTSVVSIKNGGDMTGDFKLAIGASGVDIVDDTTAHAAIADTDISGSTDALSTKLKIGMWIEVGGTDGVYDAGTDIGLKNDGTAYTSGALDEQYLSTYASKTWDKNDNAIFVGLTAGSAKKLYVKYTVDSAAGNSIQRCKVTFKATITLDQQ